MWIYIILSLQKEHERILFFAAVHSLRHEFETIDEGIVLQAERGLSHEYLGLSITPDIARLVKRL